MKFIQTNDGAIPMSRVVRIYHSMERRDGKTCEVAFAEYEDGTGETSHTKIRPNILETSYLSSIYPAHVIPAQPGFEKVTLSLKGDGYEIHREPVIGWAVNDYGETLHALTPMPDTANRTVDYGFVLAPDGKVYHFDGIWDSLEEWAAHEAEQQRSEIEERRNDGA